MTPIDKQGIKMLYFFRRVNVMKFYNIKFPAVLFFPLAVLYMELILRAFTSETFFDFGLVLVTAFSVATGLFIYALCVLIGSRAAKRFAVIVFVLLWLLFSTQAVYQNFFNKFLIIYSLTAGGADQIIAEGILENTLIAILNSLPAILLLTVPFVLIAVFFGKGIEATNLKKRSIIYFALSVVLNASVIVYITATPALSSLQSGLFDPNHTVLKFGLLRTEVLDIKYNLFGFEQEIDLEEEIPATSKPEDIEEEDFKPNVLEIDFAAKADEEDETFTLMNEYFSSAAPTYKNEYTGMYEGYNLVMMVAEGFSPYAIHPELTPTLYKMQQDGFKFNNFYTPIWGVSTSDGEFTACTGLIPKSGVWSFYRSGKNYMPFGLGNMFKGIGVDKTFAYHNNTAAYYHRDISHPNLGYDYKGMGTGVEKYVKNVWPQSDLEMISGSMVEYLSDDKPFHAYYMTVSGHLNYTRIGNSMADKNWDAVENLDCSEALKAYYACNIELDKAVEKLLLELNEKGVADKTVIAITPDHYPYGLEREDNDKYAVWREILGHDVDPTFELYESCFLLYCQSTENAPTVDKYCYSVDILPTIFNLFGMEYDSRLLMGNDIMSTEPGLVIFSDRSFITDMGKYDSRKGIFTLHEGKSFNSDEEKAAYVDGMKATVNNKFKMSAKILEKDYYGYIFDK